MSLEQRARNLLAKMELEVSYFTDNGRRIECVQLDPDQYDALELQPLMDLITLVKDAIEMLQRASSVDGLEHRRLVAWLRRRLRNLLEND